jgi:hypothetical protein
VCHTFLEPFPHVCLIFLPNFCHNCGFNFTRHTLIVFGSACACSSCSAVCHPWCASCGTKNQDSSGLTWGENHTKHDAFGMIVAFCDWESTFKRFHIGYLCGNHSLPKIRHSKLRHQPTTKVSSCQDPLWTILQFSYCSAESRLDMIIKHFKIT